MLTDKELRAIVKRHAGGYLPPGKGLPACVPADLAREILRLRSVLRGVRLYLDLRRKFWSNQEGWRRKATPPGFFLAHMEAIDRALGERKKKEVGRAKR